MKSGWGSWGALVSTFIMSSFGHAACPDGALNETAEDCPWAEIARDLSKTSSTSTPMTDRLRSATRELASQIEKDAKNPALLELWGRSINYDEFAKGTIVETPVLDAILKMGNGPLREDRIAHAGLEHTYGYLFSVLKTPYGYKRARWVKPEIALGLKLPATILSPRPPAGTLLSNVTYVMGKIAFSDPHIPAEKIAAASLKKIETQAPAELRKLNYSKLPRRRLTETVGDRVIRTDLVKTESGYLLIYSIIDPSASRQARLITAFPVDQAFADKTLSTDIGDNKVITTRYNAYVAGLSGANPPAHGSRIVTGNWQ